MGRKTDSYPGKSREAKEEWKLRLYVTNATPRCMFAYNKLKKICSERLKDRYEIEVIDVLKIPEAARRQQIVAIPTLMRLTPKPKRILIGDFSKEESVLRGLDIERAAT